MKFFIIFVLFFQIMNAESQTNTNRGGVNPDNDTAQPCSMMQILKVRKLQLKYLDILMTEEDVKEIERTQKVQQSFEALIQKQSLDADLDLIGRFKIPNCKLCVSERKQILLDLLDLYERNQACPQFEGHQEVKGWIKNIVTYGK